MMSLDTLLEAAKFLESSSKGTSKDDSAIARVNHSTSVHTERRRAISECEPLERRRRPGGAGTRETHNKLEKNRRAHLKECFDVLKKEVPSLEDKKTSNLNILRSALKHIQALKKRERDFEAERDLLTISNNSIRQRLLVLRKEINIQQDLYKASSPREEDNTKNVQPPGDSSSLESAAKSRSVESQASPVSVATQTSFTSGEEFDADGATGKLESVQVKVESNGEVEHSDEGKEDACIDDEDEDVDVEGEITDDNTEDVDSLIKEGKTMNAKVEKSLEPAASSSRSANKRKSANGDDGNKLEAKKSNIQCCARVSC